MKRMVLVGGGHAHVEVLRDLAERPEPGIEVTLVTPVPWLTYTGMVPGHIAGHYALHELAVDLEALARRAGAQVRATYATLVSPEAREVVCGDGTVIGYDALALDVGALPSVGNARGVEEHAVLMRPLDNALRGWDAVLERARIGLVRSITVVGGGAGGIEVALAMDHRLRALAPEPRPHVRLVSDAPGTGIAPGARKRLVRCMRQRGVESIVGSPVVEVARDHLRLASGLEFVTDVVFWVTGAAAPEWIGQSGLATDARGFLLTNDALQSTSHPGVFGTGDCATQKAHPRPKAGVFAVRAAPTLAANLRASLAGAPLRPHVPKPRYLALVSTGEKSAVAIWGGVSAHGRWAWKWKDRIDRRWVARYRNPPPAG